MPFLINSNNYQRSLKGSSLIFAIFIMLIVSIIISSLILMSYYHKINNSSLIEKDKVISNVKSGINLLMSDQEIISIGNPQKISLFDKYNDSVELERSQWGVFELLRCKSWWKNYEYEKVALAGDFYKSNFSYVLYLTDSDDLLTLCGQTSINGNCFLPNASVEKAYINGRGYERNVLISGNIFESKNYLPVIDSVYTNFNEEYFHRNYLENERVDQLSQGDVENDTLRNSFLEPPILIYSENSMKLSSIAFCGNIVILCDQTIEIEASCSLKDVLIYGRSVLVDKGFSGSCQIFVKDSINIGENANLLYPSVIGLINRNEEGSTNPSFVNFENGSKLHGLVYSYCESDVISIDPILITNEDVVITGQIIWDGVFDIKGTVYGSITCNKFILKTSSAVFENHLLDVTLDSDKLPNQFVGVDLFSNANLKRVVKWL